LVAGDAGVRSAPAGILGSEGRDHLTLELGPEVEHVVADPKAPRHRPRVVDRPDAAAPGSFAGLRHPGRPEVHGDPDHLVPLGDQQGGGNRAVHSAAHRDGYTSHAALRTSLRTRTASRPPTTFGDGAGV